MESTVSNQNSTLKASINLDFTLINSSFTKTPVKFTKCDQIFAGTLMGI